MPLTFLDDSGFNGMYRDEAPALLGKGQLYDARNILFDQPGMARLRGATSFLSALGAINAFCTTMGFARSDDDTPTLELMAMNGKDGVLYRVDQTTGSTVNLGAFSVADNHYGRAIPHFGFVIFPGAGSGSAFASRTTITAGPGAGATSFTTFGSTANTNFVASSRVVTLTGADVTTNIKVGQTIQAIFGGPVREYIGRVTKIVSATQINVWPVPNFTAAAPAGNTTVGNGNAGINAACAASFQNRLLLGNIIQYGGAAYDRRIQYSLLPTEEFTDATGGTLWTGATFVSTILATPPYNYIDVPGTDPIVAMEPIDDNRLLILTSTDVIIFSGNLVTQLATTSPTVTWDVFPLGTTSGCLSDHSVRRTPIGVMWAGADGIFAYWPPLRRSPAHTGLRNLTDGHIRTYWQQLVAGANFAIHGSAYVRGHYIVTGISAGTTFALCVNVVTGAWSRFSNIDFFGGIAKPTQPNQVFANIWWDQAGAAPGLNNGQMQRLDTMFDPYTAGSTKLDSDGSPVSFSITTRVFAGDPETQKIQARMTVRYQAASPGAAVAVTGQSKIDAADIVAASVRALGTLSSTEPRTIVTATNATPIVCTTTVVHGLQTDDFVDINGGLGNTHVNGRWRIKVTSTTAFELLASTGNGAYTGSSASVKKVTETDLSTTPMDAGQGASFVIASTAGIINNFELHGVRVAFYQQQPVMSA